MAATLKTLPPIKSAPAVRYATLAHRTHGRPSQEVLDRLEPFVYEWTTARRGSISAEHGIGRMKVAALHYSKTPEAIEAMMRIKQMLDPDATLNPYKVQRNGNELAALSV